MNLEEAVEFAENPEPRCPCVLLLDTSASMSGPRIAALNEGLRTFKQSLAKDPLASRRVEAAVVTFDSQVQVKQDFITADRFEPPMIQDLGPATNLCAGVSTALDLVQNRKVMYRKNGIAYYRPWVFLITDGESNEPADYVQRIAQRVKDEEAAKRVSFFAVGVEDANLGQLAKISVREPVRLNGLDFNGMFVWLSASMQRVSGARTDEQVPLQPVGWGTAG